MYTVRFIPGSKGSADMRPKTAHATWSVDARRPHLLTGVALSHHAQLAAGEQTSQRRKRGSAEGRLSETEECRLDRKSVISTK